MPSLPETDKRTCIVGSTGSGKTQFAVWLLSTRDFPKRPWIIFDFKGDGLIAEIGAREMKVTDAIPDAPGIYVVRPIPGVHDAEVTDLLWRIWARENVGVYIDEGYMIPGKQNPGLNACLTQGRSKNIEMIVLSQRPRHMPLTVFSEANYFAVFRLQLEADRQHVSTYLDGTPINRLPRFECLWYEADKQEPCHFSPCPDAGTILATFDRRKPKKRYSI